MHDPVEELVRRWGVFGRVRFLWLVVRVLMFKWCRPMGVPLWVFGLK